jgi:cytochrome b involved in lipid metabolism
MQLKYLLGSVIGVVLLLVGIYFLMQETQDETEPGTGDVRTTEVSVTDAVLSQEEVTSPVIEETVAPVSVVERSPAPSEEVVSEDTTAPVTIPTPTPTPTGYTLAQVSVHNSEGSCWTIVNESVYDVTPFVSVHPGGESKILRICGKDGTTLFEGQHGGDLRPESTLAKYRIGAYIE